MSKSKRRQIEQHKDLLQDPRYSAKTEKTIKVRKREQEEKEAREEIRRSKEGL